MFQLSKGAPTGEAIQQAANSLTFRLTDDIPGVGGAGQVVTMTTAPGDTYTVEEIATYLAGYTQEGVFRADEIAPPILCNREVVKVRTANVKNEFRRARPTTSLHAAVNQVDLDSDVAEKTMTPYALGALVEMATADMSSFDLRAAKGRQLKGLIDLDREYRMWTLLTTSGTWDSSVKTTLTTTNQWWYGSAEGTTSNPIIDLLTREAASGMEITGWYMSRAVAIRFLTHTKVVAYMRQMLGDAAPNPQTAVGKNSNFVIPGIAPIHISSAKEYTDSTGALDLLLNDTVIGVRTIAGVPTGATDIATVKTFRYRTPSGTGILTRVVPLLGHGIYGAELMIVGVHEDIYATSSIVGGAIFDVLG